MRASQDHSESPHRACRVTSITSFVHLGHLSGVFTDDERVGTPTPAISSFYDRTSTNQFPSEHNHHLQFNLLLCAFRFRRTLCCRLVSLKASSRLRLKDLVPQSNKTLNCVLLSNTKAVRHKSRLPSRRQIYREDVIRRADI